MVVAALAVRLSVALTVAVPPLSEIDAGDSDSVTPCAHAGPAANAATTANTKPAAFTAPSLLISAERRLRLRTMLTSLKSPKAVARGR